MEVTSLGGKTKGEEKHMDTTVSKARTNARKKVRQKVAKLGFKVTPESLETLTLKDLMYMVEKKTKRRQAQPSPKDESLVSDMELVVFYEIYRKCRQTGVIGYRSIEENMGWHNRKGFNALDMAEGRCKRTSPKKLWLDFRRSARKATKNQEAKPQEPQAEPQVAPAEPQVAVA